MVDFQKTTAFVTRLVESEIQLLVFQHPLAGIQVPAGSVEAGEDPGAGALRETEEETGLKCLRSLAFGVAMGSNSSEI